MIKTNDCLKRLFHACLLISCVYVVSTQTASTAQAGRYPVPRLFQGTNTAIAHVGFSPTVIALGTEREQIESMPILARPYRPLHFYGNTIRRRHYRQLLR